MEPHNSNGKNNPTDAIFQDLKHNITKENLNAIKKKHRYLEDSHLQTKSIKKPTIKRQHEALSNQRDSKEESISSDSLSDYELEEREEVFNNLIYPDKQHSLQFSPQCKDILAFQYRYFTPQSRIKQLQRSVSLSQQKLKLTQQYHQRQIQTISGKHSLSVRDLNHQIQKLKLIISYNDSKQLRIKQLTKENSNLRQSLSTFQEKYWKTHQIENLLAKTQTENNNLHSQIVQLKALLDQQKTLHQLQHNKPLNSNNKEIQNSTLKHQQKVINKLQKRVNDLQKQSQIDQFHYQEIISSYQRKIEDQQEIIKLKQKSLNQCHLTLQKLKVQKQKVQKSLLLTMDSFSKHLVNQSAQNSQLGIAHPNKHFNSPNVESHKATQNYLRPYQVGLIAEQTMNLQLIASQSLQNKENKTFQRSHHPQLTSFSPVPIKKTMFEVNQTRFLTHHDYIKSGKQPRKQSGHQKPPQNQIQEETFYPQRNTRILSHQVASQKRKRGQSGANYRQVMGWRNDPQKEEQSKIGRLEKKLELANLKIVELLKQKLSKGLSFQRE